MPQSTWDEILVKRPWKQQGVTIKASSQVTAAANTTAVYVGKGLFYLKFGVTAIANGTGDVLRCEVQTNKYATKDINVSSKVVWDADFVTSNTIDMTVNGVSMTQVTFTTDHATTIAAVVTNLSAMSGITAELDATDTNSRTIIIKKDAPRTTAIGTVTETVAAGASQADGTITYDGDWYTIGVFTFDDAIQGSVVDAVGSYPLIVMNENDYQMRIKQTIVSSPDVTYSVVATPARDMVAV